jgi:hypothetical protein
MQADILLQAAAQPVDRARLLAACSLGYGVWLEALPLSTVGLKMLKQAVRIAAGLRLGAPVVRPHVCVCGTTVSADGHHGLSCRHGSGRYGRHNQVNDLLCYAFISADTPATREPHSLCTSNGQRPDGVTQVPWSRSGVWPGILPVRTRTPCHISRQAVLKLVLQQQQLKWSRRRSMPTHFLRILYACSHRDIRCLGRAGH